MKFPILASSILAAVTVLQLAPASRADVVYFGLQNVPIPTDFEGIYLDVNTGATGTSPISGWDINAVFGGSRVYTSETFQPVRTGEGFDDPIVALGLGVLVNGILTFSSGFGASGAGSTSGVSHMGAGPGQFQPGSEAYLGFKLTPADGSAGKYGWMRVIFTNGSSEGVIKDWAYETGGGPIRTGNILQAAPAGGVSVVTLSGGAGENATLSSALSDVGSGVVTSLTKTGAGTWTLSGDKTYTGTTSIDANGGTLEVGSSGGRLAGTSVIVVNNGGTLLLGGLSTTTDRLNDSASVNLAGGTLNTGGLSEGTALIAGIGALTLSTDSTLDLGAGSSLLHFAASNSAIWTSSALLTIINWSGSPAGSGTDRLYFGQNESALTTMQLGQIRFDLGDGNYLGAGLLSTGELVPVPEPATWLSAGLLLGAVAWRERGSLLSRLRRNAKA